MPPGQESRACVPEARGTISGGRSRACGPLRAALRPESPRFEAIPLPIGVLPPPSRCYTVVQPTGKLLRSLSSVTPRFSRPQPPLGVPSLAGKTVTTPLAPRFKTRLDRSSVPEIGGEWVFLIGQRAANGLFPSFSGGRARPCGEICTRRHHSEAKYPQMPHPPEGSRPKNPHIP